MLEVSFVIVTPSLVGSGSEPTLDLATVVGTNAVAPDNILDLKCKKERSNRLWTNHLCFKNSFLMHQPLKIDWQTVLVVNGHIYRWKSGCLSVIMLAASGRHTVERSWDAKILVEIRSLQLPAYARPFCVRPCLVQIHLLGKSVWIVEQSVGICKYFCLFRKSAPRQVHIIRLSRARCNSKIKD